MYKIVFYTWDPYGTFTGCLLYAKWARATVIPLSEMDRWIGKPHLEGSNYMEIYFGGGLLHILGVQV